VSALRSAQRSGPAALFAVLATSSSCAVDGPPAPAICHAELDVLTPWQNGPAAMPSCAAGAFSASWLAARDGTVFFTAGTSLCALEGEGPARTVNTTGARGGDSSNIKALWVDGDRLVYADLNGINGVPIAGGDPAVLVDSTPIRCRTAAPTRSTERRCTGGRA
jgi:hypothetical protein